MVNAILYVCRTGIPWWYLPHDFPPYVMGREAGVEPSAEPSTGLVDVTRTRLSDLRRCPTSRQVEQAQRMIDELLVAVPPAREQTQNLFTTVYRNN